MAIRPIAALSILLATATAAIGQQPQIVGGEPVAVGQFPFLVFAYNLQTDYGCTGSLIRDNWVLTAAHCALNGVPPSHVIIGDSFPGVLGPTHTADSVAVAQWISHPGYVAATLTNDVALIRLAEGAAQHPPRLAGQPLYTPSAIQLATSPATTAASIGNLIIAGFGEIDGGAAPRFAYWADEIPTHAMSFCQTKYLNPLSASTQLCFGTYPNVCHGDSGGAVFRETTGVFTEYGIVSGSGANCGDPGSLASYVPAYRSWINLQIDGPPAASPIQYGWEFPLSSAGGVASGISNFQGWAFSKAGAITSVRLERDGVRVVSGPCCSERGDVQKAVPGAPLNTGFVAVVNWGNLGDKLNNLTLVINDSAGNELRENRTVKTVQLLNGVPFVSGLTFTPSTSCALFNDGGRASAECSHLTFQQGTCAGDITFGWQTGKQAFEVLEGCH